VASVSDIAVVDALHAALAKRDLLPEVHVVDAGYVAGLITPARTEHGIDLLGPMKGITAWQASDSGYTLEDSPSTGATSESPARTARVPPCGIRIVRPGACRSSGWSSAPRAASPVRLAASAQPLEIFNDAGYVGA
jgi:hypothetical protein